MPETFLEKGIINQYELIDSVIASLNQIPVYGETNMKKLVFACECLRTLKKGLKEAEEKRNEQQTAN